MRSRRELLRLGSSCVLAAALHARGADASGAPSSTRATREVDAAASEAAAQAAQVRPGVLLRFPRDHGSHPQFRTEWWYATGWLRVVPAAASRSRDAAELGFQVTFFRTRPRLGDAEHNPSAFTARQIIIAHAAISDPARGSLWKEQRIARAGFGLAGAAEQDTQVWLDDWRFERRGVPGSSGTSRYRAEIAGEELGLALTLLARSPPMLNGDAGYSQKGPATSSASYYYSRPGLEVRGAIVRGGRRSAVEGEAWLDHEWSSAYLDEQASGWDWVALNLADGGSLMAFRIRTRDGAMHWGGATWRRSDGGRRSYAPAEIRFEPLRRWRSPRTGIDWPVEFRVSLAGDFVLHLRPLMPDQESDTRATTGAVYWEGAVRAFDASARAGAEIGRGYLELTGYGDALRLP